MASLELKGIRKSFGATPVLDHIDLAIEQREFIAFLGPSGSGKSTLLRIIAGLETADEGEVWLEGRRIDPLPPGERGVARVFQHYALYPHMSVRENMTFGLKNAKVGRNEIETRHRVNFDECVQALAQTAKEMNSKYKETSEAGLALSVVLC